LLRVEELRAGARAASRINPGRSERAELTQAREPLVGLAELEPRVILVRHEIADE
jgi:hypothetical protein